MEVSNSESVKQPSKRKLKKLYCNIRAQMEFYFSDSNLVKDKFLQELIGKSDDGYVDLEVFKTFNKIKALTEDINMISKAVSRSSILEISPDGMKIRRSTPLSISKEFDACTLYVEKLPQYADRKWIKDVFEHFGSIDCINIPRFKVSQKIKGFAFVEFSNPESVRKACEFYKNSTGKECVSSEDENKYAKPDNEKKKQMQSHKNSKKRKLEDAAGDDPPKRVKKNSLSSEDNVPTKLSCERLLPSDAEEGMVLSEQQNETEATNEQSLSTSENVTNLHGEDTPSKSKKKRKHAKKNHNTDRPILRVMTKAEWKSYRNKYLALQRTTMSHIKKRILLESQELRDQEMSAKTVDHADIPKKGLQFQPGVIIKIRLPEPITNSSTIKDQVKANVVVAYVDAPLGESEIFIRCYTAEEALSLINENKLHHLGSAELLKDSQEAEYWQKN